MFMFLSAIFGFIFVVLPYICIVAVLTLISVGLGLKPESEWDVNRKVGR